MNDRHTPQNLVEHVLGASLGRRDFLTKAAAAGAIAWTAPMILSRPAYAAEGGAGSPKCRPSISVAITTHSCPRSGGAGGAQTFPAVRITVGNCGCGPQAPKVCVRIADFTQVLPLPLLGPAIQVYGDLTDCTANGTTEQLSTTAWNSVTPVGGTKVIFFGPPRSGGGSGQLVAPALTTINFRLAVWAGNCPDGSSSTGAYNCRTDLITIVWTSLLGLEVGTGLGITPTLCTSGATSPC